MIPPWLPDWKDERAYPEKLAPEFWAWEFLRRNAEYQDDYRVFAALPDAEGKWKGSPWSGGRIDYFYCDPPALPGELTRDYMVRMNNDYEVVPWVDHLIKKWGVFPIQDPAESQPLRIGRDLYSEEPPYVYFDGRVRHSEIWHSPPFVFDLRRSLDEQLTEAKQVLKDLRATWGPKPWGFSIERGKRIENNKIYRTYVRMLDADLHGARPEEMAEWLYPDSDPSTVSKALRAACDLRDGDYRDLLERL